MSWAGTREEVEEITREMLAYRVDKIYTGHCTKKKGFKVLKRVMGENIEYLTTGWELFF